ncbi:MAG: hypothetical protein HC908_07965 [Calothrix sp. SM1_7_51]|nr:hypothetical protein [Calothrix sp. SM1_7_51]
MAEQMHLTAIEEMLSQKIGFDSNTIGARAIARLVENRRRACNLPDIKTYSSFYRPLQRNLHNWSKN